MKDTFRARLTACVAGVAIASALAGCGGSDDAGEATGDDKARVVELLVAAADEEGFGLDTECVTGYVGELSDDDARELAEAGLTGDADVSGDGEAIGAALFRDCVDAASYADAIAEAFAEADPSVDVECLKGALGGLTTDEIDDQFLDRVEDCSTDG